MRSRAKRRATRAKRAASAEHQLDLARRPDGAIGSRPAHAPGLAIVSPLLSVLSPVGTSLLGLRTGSIATWRTPDGGEGTARIAEILFQPEACAVNNGKEARN
jgi:hypothetical protein